MTSTNINPRQQAVLAFKRLHSDEKLAVMALIFTQLAEQIPASAIDALPTESVASLLSRVQQLSHEEQLFALRDLLSAQSTSQDEIMLDPHPTKAMLELVKGGTTIPTGQYNSLSNEAKLAFWYLLAQRMGTTIIGIPSSYHPSEEAAKVFNSLKSMNSDELVLFLQQVL